LKWRLFPIGRRISCPGAAAVGARRGTARPRQGDRSASARPRDKKKRTGAKAAAPFAGMLYSIYALMQPDLRDQPCWAGVRTTSPSSSGFTVIWQHRREFGFTSKAKSSMSSSICEALPVFSTHFSST